MNNSSLCSVTSPPPPALEIIMLLQEKNVMYIRLHMHGLLILIPKVHNKIVCTLANNYIMCSKNNVFSPLIYTVP